MKIINVFNGEECKKIISSIEDNIEQLKISNENGWSYLSAYEMNTAKLPIEIQSLIQDKIKDISNFKVTQNFVIKYNKNLVPGMLGHYDASSLTIPINLNNNFKGGETNFPFLKHKHIPQNYANGSGLLFKGDKLKSWHEALPVTEGDRYVLVLKFNKTNNVFIQLFTLIKLLISTKIIELFIKKPS